MQTEPKMIKIDRVGLFVIEVIMNESMYIHHAVLGFEEYLRKFDESELEAWPSVERLIYMWLTEGQAINDCGGSRSIFLSAVAVIFAQWHDACHKDEKQVIPSTIVQARMEPGEVNRGEIFDPYAFIIVKDLVDRGVFD